MALLDLLYGDQSLWAAEKVYCCLRRKTDNQEEDRFSLIGEVVGWGARRREERIMTPGFGKIPFYEGGIWLA